MNTHSTDKKVGTLKSYVWGMFLDFSIFDICNFHHIQPLNPDIVGFLYPPSRSGTTLNFLTCLLLADEGDWPPGPFSLLKQKGLKDMF